jgi:hypothetical protein
LTRRDASFSQESGRKSEVVIEVQSKFVRSDRTRIDILNLLGSGGGEPSDAGGEVQFAMILHGRRMAPGWR